MIAKAACCWVMSSCSINADPITASGDLLNVLEKYAVGTTVTVAVLREGTRVTVPVTLQPLR